MNYWRETWLKFRDIKSSGFWSINIVSSLGLGMGVFKFNIFGVEQLDNLCKLGILLVGILTISFGWCMANVGYHRLFNKLRSGYLITCVNGVERTQNILMITDGRDIRARKQAIVDAVELIHQIAQVVTGQNCGVSIKVPINPHEEHHIWKMRTIVRDSDHFERDNDRYKGKDHLINRNTAYLQIINELQDGKSSYKYLNNNRVDDKGYQTTSDGCYPSLPQYVAEIVCPILQPGADPNTLFELRGFLCVDCPTKYPFRNDRTTASIFGICAKMMHPLLTNYNTD